MTGEELIREVWRRWNAGDRELDPELFDPEFEAHSQLTGRVYRGPEQVREWIAEIDEQFDTWELEVDSAREVGDGVTLAGGWIRAQGRASGIGLDEPAAWTVRVRDGRLLAVHNHIGSKAVAEAEESAR